MSTIYFDVRKILFNAHKKLPFPELRYYDYRIFETAEQAFNLTRKGAVNAEIIINFNLTEFTERFENTDSRYIILENVPIDILNKIKLEHS